MDELQPILEAVEALVTGLPTSADRVHFDPKEPFDAESDDTPAWVIDPGEDVVVETDKAGSERHSFTINLVGVVEGVSDVLPILHTMRGEVIAALKGSTLGGLVLQLRYERSTSQAIAEGSSESGLIEVVFTADYFT